MTMPEVTQQPCPAPEAHGQTHHLIPRRAGRTPQGEPAYQHVCRYCDRTERELRDELLRDTD